MIGSPFIAHFHAVLDANWFLAGMFLFVSLVIAHVVGVLFARSLRIAPGHAREVMPSLPVAPTHKGRAAVRFHRAVLRVERLLLREFADGVENAEASALAAVLSEDPLVVAAALERLRESIPCRMQITASGKILHDFTAEDVVSLKRKRTVWLPMRVGVFALAALANIGAIWPVILIMTLALWTLDVAVSNPSEQAVKLGALGLLAVVVAFCVAMAAGLITRFLLTPLTSAPKLGAAREDVAAPVRRSVEAREETAWWAWFGANATSSRGRRKKEAWWKRSSGGSSGGSSGDSDGDGAALGQVIIIVVAVAILVLCTIALFVWGRGLWRAVSRDERELERLSPAFWVRSAVVIDFFERFVPTNDLVGRVYRTLGHAHAHRRPVDEDLGPRVLLLATSRRGRVSTIDIALSEGVDLDEAAEIGSRLCGIVGGRILVSEHGDLVFEFPPDVLREIEATPDEDMWAEYLDLDPVIDNIRRRFGQSATELPVNLVGLTHSHLVATDRLVGGTWLMAISGMVLLSAPELLPFQLFGPLNALLAAIAHASTPITLLLFAFATGATCLSAATRYSARAVAIHGVRRDARRATFEVIRGALGHGRDRIDLSPLPGRLAATFRPAWRGASEPDLEKEVLGVLVDLDLGPALDAQGRLEIDLSALRGRRNSAKTAHDSIDSSSTFDAASDDSVVFSTEIRHDRVKLLA